VKKQTVIGALGAAAVLAVPTAAQAKPHCESVSPAAAKLNAVMTRQVRKLIDNKHFEPTVVTLTPKVRHVHGFIGSGELFVRSPSTTSPVTAAFVIRGEEKCAIEITSANLDLRRNGFAISFDTIVGARNLGKITVTMISI
jgi:hypothetical protein